MSELKVNIVSFDIPYPATYGGSIDVFYKIRALKKAGFKIILHCFQYNKKEQSELEKYCEKVFYYRRKRGLAYMFSSLPYIVITRKNNNLLKNLGKNSYPILFEGLHTCYYLRHETLKNRIKIVRTHNIEHHYYSGLMHASKNIFKKIYYALEAKKLKVFEPVLNHASVIAAISKSDYEYFEKEYGRAIQINAFHPFEELNSKPGKGNYFLYHGNLEVEENEKAVLFLLNEVVGKCNARFIIAGRNPSHKVSKKINQTTNVQLIANPSESEIFDLIQNASACVLPTFQESGLKLKLLYSLFAGRHVIVNQAMVANTDLESICYHANSAGEFIGLTEKLNSLTFNTEHLAMREKVLEKFKNDYNAKQLSHILQSNEENILFYTD